MQRTNLLQAGTSRSSGDLFTPASARQEAPLPVWRKTNLIAFLRASVLTALIFAAAAWASHQNMNCIDMVKSLKSAE